MARLPRALNPFELYRAWWADIGPRRGPDTVRSYRYCVLRALADLGADPLSLTAGELRRYLGGLRKPYAKLTHAALGDFFAFLLRRGLLESSPLQSIKVGPPKRRRVKRGLTREELVRLLVALVRASGERMAWGALAQYGLGLRPGEIVALGTDNVVLDGDASCVYVDEGKTQGVVPIGPLARAALEELLDGRPGRLLPVGRSQWWAHIRRAAMLAGLPPEKCRPYALRHSFGTHLAERGVHIRVIAELLRQTDLRATFVYTTPSDESLRAAVDLLG